MEQLFLNNKHLTYIFHYKYKIKHRTKTYYRCIKNYGSNIFR